ncbi:uncharacterized protein CCR75_002743 [Bremia lactucae]|uniref:Uncharacterized protein n=1 Tax=Bremia lactucae TaxID=4779 RepID=A0A976IBN6_BRELC|nr:hypothetical protein CCR75_002743 [Bremia lactucae]
MREGFARVACGVALLIRRADTTTAADAAEVAMPEQVQSLETALNNTSGVQFLRSPHMTALNEERDLKALVKKLLHIRTNKVTDVNVLEKKVLNDIIAGDDIEKSMKVAEYAIVYKINLFNKKSTAYHVFQNIVKENIVDNDFDKFIIRILKLISPSDKAVNQYKEIVDLSTRKPVSTTADAVHNTPHIETSTTDVTKTKKVPPYIEKVRPVLREMIIEDLKFAMATRSDIDWRFSNFIMAVIRDVSPSYVYDVYKVWDKLDAHTFAEKVQAPKYAPSIVDDAELIFVHRDQLNRLHAAKLKKLGKK